MEFDKVLTSRKSIRTYTGEQLTEAELATVLKAANAAPVGMGKYELAHMTVIQNAELLAEIDKAGAVVFGNPDMHPLYGAPTLIVLSAPTGDDFNMNNVLCSNAAMIVHNMALEATELGLGHVDIWGCMRAVKASPELTAKLGLPEGFTPLCAIALGKTEDVYEEREIPDRIGTDFIK